MVVAIDVPKRAIMESAMGSAAFFMSVEIRSANITMGAAESIVSSIRHASITKEGTESTFPPMTQMSGINISPMPKKSIHSRASINAATTVAPIHQMGEDATAKDMEEVALRIEEALRADGESRVFVGIGTLALHLRDLAKSYKEAQIAIEVGKVFDTERYVINYENLGIGRLIYQLPTTLCEMFLQEVFKKNPIDALDQETLFTIYKFFENNLNVSETARKLFVHRNTLVYRLEKIKKLTGLDLREFDDAITFKVALMVKKYLTSRGIDA